MGAGLAGGLVAGSNFGSPLPGFISTLRAIIAAVLRDGSPGGKLLSAKLANTLYSDVGAHVQ